jgi:Na+-driven multidrug efflux pump
VVFENFLQNCNSSDQIATVSLGLNGTAFQPLLVAIAAILNGASQAYGVAVEGLAAMLHRYTIVEFELITIVPRCYSTDV